MWLHKLCIICFSQCHSEGLYIYLILILVLDIKSKDGNNNDDDDNVTILKVWI